MNTRKSRIGIALALIAAMLAATAIYVHAKQAQGNPASVAEKENAADTIAPAVEAFPMQVATNGRPDYMNNVESFLAMPWKSLNAMQASETVTDYFGGQGMTTVREREYNAYGQVSCESLSSPQQPGETISMTESGTDNPARLTP